VRIETGLFGLSSGATTSVQSMMPSKMGLMAQIVWGYRLGCILVLGQTAKQVRIVPYWIRFARTQAGESNPHASRSKKCCFGKPISCRVDERGEWLYQEADFPDHGMLRGGLGTRGLHLGSFQEGKKGGGGVTTLDGCDGLAICGLL
jgi:hypothetical protein